MEHPDFDKASPLDIARWHAIQASRLAVEVQNMLPPRGSRAAADDKNLVAKKNDAITASAGAAAAWVSVAQIESLAMVMRE